MVWQRNLYSCVGVICGGGGLQCAQEPTAGQHMLLPVWRNKALASIGGEINCAKACVRKQEAATLTRL